MSHFSHSFPLTHKMPSILFVFTSANKTLTGAQTVSVGYLRGDLETDYFLEQLLLLNLIIGMVLT